MKNNLLFIFFIVIYPLISGNNWEVVHKSDISTYNINKFDSFDKSRICACGAKGLFLISENSGEAWTERYVGTDTDLKSIQYYDSTTIWACGVNGVIIRYDSKKNNYLDLSIDWKIDLNTISFADEKIGLTGSNKGVVYRTTDGGKSWDSTYYVPEYSISYIKMINEKEGFFFAVAAKGKNGSRLYRTVNKGLSWFPILVLKDEKIACFYQYGNDLWLSGYYGLLMRSTNNGKSWQWFDMKTSESIWSIAILGNYLYAAVGMWENTGIRKARIDSMIWEPELDSGKDNCFRLVTNGISLFTFVFDGKSNGRHELLRKTPDK